jgi:flagellar protein FliO/FliZ
VALPSWIALALALIISAATLARADTPQLADAVSTAHLLAPTLAQAQPPVDPLMADDAEPLSMAGTLLQTLLVLGIVIGLVYVTLNFGLRRMMGLRALPAGAATLVKVVERIPLDPKRSLFVVQAAGEYLLVGGGDDGLSLIGKLDTAEVERVLSQRAATPGQISPFLQKLLSRKDGTSPVEKV